MANEERPHLNTGEIPEHFHSFETGEPMRQCKVCDRDLMKSDVPYVIEKAFRRYKEYNTIDVVFEHAICHPCQLMLASQLSKESMQKMQDFFTERVDFQQRNEQMLKYGTGEEWYNNCLINGTDESELEEFQIFGMCIGDQMVYDAFPYMLSGKAMDELIPLISDETMDELNNFKDTFFDWPPELRELLKDRPVGVI